MSNKAKDIDIKNRTYYFLDDIIKIKYFGSHNIKINEKSYKSVLIYGSGYIAIKDCDASKECDVCHQWYFLNFSSKFQPNACNRCHDLIMMSVNLSDIAIFNIKGSDYCCIISLISKSEALNLMQNAALTEKIGTL